MEYAGLVLFILAIVAGWLLTLLSLPGNWVIVAAAAVYAWLMPAGSGRAIGWTVVFALLGLAVLAELLELATSAMGTAKAGGSKRGAALAVVGSVAGAITGALVGLPIPLVGSVVAAVLFAALGAMGGAMLGETWKGRALRESWEVGQGAFVGRLLGTLAKTTIASAMAVIAAMAAIF